MKQFNLKTEKGGIWEGFHLGKEEQGCWVQQQAPLKRGEPPFPIRRIVAQCFIQRGFCTFCTFRTAIMVPTGCNWDDIVWGPSAIKTLISFMEAKQRMRESERASKSQRISTIRLFLMYYSLELLDRKRYNHQQIQLINSPQHADGKLNGSSSFKVVSWVTHCTDRADRATTRWNCEAFY